VKRSISAKACLHGNFRLGHEHRYAGPVVSMLTWYGDFPEPWHLPQTRVSVLPTSDQGPGPDSLRAAARDALSGAARSTACSVQLGTVRAYAMPLTTAVG